ncbi:MAG: PepSY domain-containing protein [Gammaproteobacteria bacterium]
MSTTTLGYSNPPTQNAGSEPAASGRFYRVVWRWHFYAGLFVIPVLLILAITGSIYLFKPQLDRWMYRELMFVEPGAAALSYDRQLDAARAAYPTAKLTKFTPAVTADRSAEVGLTTRDGHDLAVFVNPYTGKVLGERDEHANLQAYARKIHGELMIGKVGDTIVELAACWALVLIVSGVYMWWPRHGSAIWGTLLPRLHADGRTFWRDLHAVPGFYGALLVVFLVLTGLPWAGFWGDNFAKVWSRYPEFMWDSAPNAKQLTAALNQNGVQTVAWAAEQLPMPKSIVPGHAEHQSSASASTSAASAEGQSAMPVSLGGIIALAQANGVTPGYSVSLPGDAEAVYTVSAVPNDPTLERTLHIDQYSGKVLADLGWAQYGPVPKAVEFGIAIHMGKYFGLANQLLMLAICLIVITLTITGAVMWWRRRPAGRLGAPAMPANFPLWKTAVAIIAVLGVAFPFVGISLVAVLLVDYLVISRIRPLKQALG